LPQDVDPTTWLQNTLEHKEDTGLNIPTKTDGTPYLIKDLQEDQKKVVYHVVQVLHKFIKRKRNTWPTTDGMTVAGGAGTGKSTTINTIVTIVRKMFGYNDAVKVFAPTGSAAFNAGGETIHRGFGVGIGTTGNNMSAQKKDYIARNFGRTFLVIIDERSMMGAKLFGTAELHCRQALQAVGRDPKARWGGIPMILLVGDDYQLLPAGYGAIYAPPEVNIVDNEKRSPQVKMLEENGFQEFLHLSEKCIHLQTVKRVNDDQSLLVDILDKSSGRQLVDLPQEYKEKLMRLHLGKPHFTDKDRKAIEDRSMYIFANKEPRDEFNLMKLKQTHNKERPVAKIKSTTTKGGNVKRPSAHFDEERTPASASICVGAKVHLNNTNYEPSWGLYHGSIGTVMDIVYEKDQSPNLGDSPKYVLVNFDQYCGPTFCTEHPTAVPITMHTTRCQNQCCTRHYLPLTLAWAKTIHTFQGQTIGPVPPGRPPNAVECIIIEPGTKEFETKCPGLFYTALGRGTTLGDFIDKLSSSMYFRGSNMNEFRITNLWACLNGQPSKKVQLRKNWSERLRRNSINHKKISTGVMEAKLLWATTTVLTRNQIEALFTYKHQH
jgi:hypothetical protein